MKKVIDLQKNTSSDLDIKTLFPKQELGVEERVSQKATEDFGTKRKDIYLQSKKEVSFVGKNTPFFDALGKKGVFQRLRDPLIISLKKYVDRKTPLSHIKRPTFFSKNELIFPTFSLGFFIVSFCILLAVLYIDKIFVENRVISGYQKLLDVGEQDSSGQGFVKNINDARFDFLLADIFFTPFRLLPYEQAQNAYHGIKGGRYLTDSLDSLLSIYHKTEVFLEKKDIQEVYFTQLFENLREDFQDIEETLDTSLSHYESITSLGDTILDQKLNQGKQKLFVFQKYIQTLNKDYDSFLSLLGHNQKREYLVVFQNADEIRPTGGFMGSMGVVTLFRGQVQDFTMRDVYAFEWDLKSSDYERQSAPPGIDSLTDTFGLRDANYYINLADSSNKIRFFIEESGQDIDGIIYINQNVILDFLALTGGIFFEPTQRVVTQENFSELMSLLVEAKLFKVGTLGTPKQILFDFFDLYKGLLLEKKEYLSYLQILYKHVESRDIMMYSFRPAEQDFLGDLGISGKIDYEKTLDFNYPVFTSLSGNKSDRYVERFYSKNITTNTNDCSIRTDFTLSQRHTFSKQDELRISLEQEDFGIEETNTLQIQGAGPNKQFVRILIPASASNVELAPGMQLVDYGVRKGIEFYTTIIASQRRDDSFSYTLQNSRCQKYDYMFYKQPGIRNYDIEIKNQERKDSFSGNTQDFFYSLQ